MFQLSSFQLWRLRGIIVVLCIIEYLIYVLKPGCSSIKFDTLNLIPSLFAVWCFSYFDISVVKEKEKKKSNNRQNVRRVKIQRTCERCFRFSVEVKNCLIITRCHFGFLCTRKKFRKWKIVQNTRNIKNM